MLNPSRSDLMIIVIMESLSSFIVGCISLVFAILLWKNVLCIDHNWIIQPSQKTKISAIIGSVTPVISSFFNVLVFILLWYDSPVFMYLSLAVNFTNAIGSRFYYYYLTFNIKNEMDQNEIIKYAVSKISVILLIVYLIIDILYLMVTTSIDITYYASDGLNENTMAVIWNIDDIYVIFTTFILDFLLLYIYIGSLFKYAKWWRRKNWQESEKYGFNEREHEILIRITRFTVVCTMVAIFDILCAVFGHFIDYNVGLFITDGVLNQLSSLIRVSSIYFSFEFGHAAYLKTYGKIHYRCSKIAKWGMRKTQNGYVEMLDGN